MTDNSRWLAFGEHEDDFEDEPVLACFVAKLYYYWRGRNAYWGSWSSQYPGHDAFSLQIEELKQRIECRRAQGSTFTILEVPVLALCGKDDALIVGEINTNSPLRDYKLPLKPSTNIAALANAFEPNKPNSVVRFVCRSIDVSPAHFPFKNHSSRTAGPQYLLNWSISVTQVELEPILARASQTCRRLQRQ